MLSPRGRAQLFAWLLRDPVRIRKFESFIRPYLAVAVVISMQHILEKAKNIRLVIFDVDGVLTDGTLYLTDSGEEIKAFNSQDGHGLKMLKASGVSIALITGRKSRCVDLKAKDWGVTSFIRAQRASCLCSRRC